MQVQKGTCVLYLQPGRSQPWALPWDGVCICSVGIDAPHRAPSPEPPITLVPSLEPGLGIPGTETPKAGFPSVHGKLAVCAGKNPAQAISLGHFSFF